MELLLKIHDEFILLVTSSSFFLIYLASAPLVGLRKEALAVFTISCLLVRGNKKNDGANPERKLTVNASTDTQVFEVLPNKGQSGIGGETVGQFFNNKVSHVKLTFWVSRTCEISR
jgi:hypothetical protein